MRESFLAPALAGIPSRECRAFPLLWCEKGLSQQPALQLELETWISKLRRPGTAGATFTGQDSFGSQERYGKGGARTGLAGHRNRAAQLFDDVAADGE